MSVNLNIFHPSLKLAYAFLITFCVENDLPFNITSMHRSGDSGPHGSLPLRAFDFSIKGWEEVDMLKFEHEINLKYEYLGAKSLSDNVQRLVIFHEVEGRGSLHGHIQVLP